MKTFTELKNAQSITIAYDGLNPMPPMFCCLKPYYNDVNKSYFHESADGEVCMLLLAVNIERNWSGATDCQLCTLGIGSKQRTGIRNASCRCPGDRHTYF